GSRRLGLLLGRGGERGERHPVGEPSRHAVPAPTARVVVNPLRYNRTSETVGDRLCLCLVVGGAWMDAPSQNARPIPRRRLYRPPPSRRSPVGGEGFAGLPKRFGHGDALIDVFSQLLHSCDQGGEG